MKKLFTVIAIFISILASNAQEMVTTYEGVLGNTTGFDVASFTDIRDKTLNDIMNKLPGVSAGGFGLSYNGMRIGKIFINNNDVRSGFNTVAGIKPENIERIEFVENYQAIKVLQNRQFSNSAALNIILKDNSRSNWNGSLRIGGGGPALYDGDLFAIQLTNMRQSMFNVKINNTGLNLRRGTSFFSQDNLGFNTDFFRLPSYVNVRSSSARLSEERVRFNKSMFLNTINNIKLSDNYQMVLQFAYQKDNLESGNSAQTTYFLNDSNVIDSSGEAALSESEEVTGVIAVLANTDKYYFSNDIFAQANINSTKMNLTGTHPNIQSGKTKYYNLTDNLSYIRSFGQLRQWNLTVLSRNQLNSFPQVLSVAREDSSRQDQSVDTKSIFSDSRISYSLTSDKWTVGLRGGFTFMNRKLTSILNGIGDIVINNNESSFGYTRAYIQPTVNFVSDRLQGEVGLPVNLYHYMFSEDQLPDDLGSGPSSGNDVVNFTPFISLQYYITPVLSVALDGRIQYDDINAGNFYTGMILTNYRYINQGALNYRLDEEHSLQTTVAYRLPKQSLFINGRFQRQWGKSQYSNFDTFINDFVIRGTIPQENDSRSWLVSGDVNKGITSLRGSVGLSVSFSNSESSRIRNSQTILFTSNRWTVSPKINGRLNRWLNIIYDLTYNLSNVKISGGSNSTSDEFNQSVEFIFTPLKVFNFSILGEHYHTQLTEDLTKNMLLSDFKAEYQLSDKWQLIGTVTNILDQRDFAYTLVDGLNTYHTSYRIRPRNFVLSLYYKF